MADTPSPPKPNRYRIEAVDRAFALLSALSVAKRMSASQLADALGANRSLVFRMLSTLADRGVVTKDADNFYSLGPTLLHLGLRAEGGNALIAASRDVLDSLVESTQENVQLFVRDQYDVMGTALRVAKQHVSLSEVVAMKGGLHSGGVHKLLLAYAPEEIIDAVIEQHLGEFLPATLRTRKQVLSLLSKIREDGFYVAIAEALPDIYTISVPVADGRGEVSSAIAVMGPISRLDASKQKAILRLLRDGAALVSSRLR
jgi:DNA-binding IclR family transcriptional regulator